ncbi:MAG: alpha/beta hydrolase, partial [Planctomycetota bacterium]
MALVLRFLIVAVSLSAALEAAAQDDVKDIPSRKLQAGNDTHKSYFLIGPAEGQKEPDRGYNLLVVLPGGDGSAAFLPFVKRIYKHGTPDGYLVVQLVAPKWTPKQQIVWPHRKNKVPGMKFGTEQFVDAVVADVRKRCRINAKHVFSLSWSSSGPAVYATSLQRDKPVTGSYVAMSVFNKQYLPPLSHAKGHAYYIEHSPDDRVCPFWMANWANKELTNAGARVRLA